MQQLEKSVYWYDEVCKRLELLHVESRKTKDCDATPPSDFLFEIVRKTIEDVRRLVGFSTKLPIADVWLGPNGEIGLTWEFNEDKSVDLVFGAKSWAASFSDNLKQFPVAANDLPKLLSDLAA